MRQFFANRAVYPLSSETESTRVRSRFRTRTGALYLRSGSRNAQLGSIMRGPGTCRATAALPVVPRQAVARGFDAFGLPRVIGWPRGAAG